MADHVVVMRDGVIEQQGRPLDLYDRPANRFVAGFIGSPAMNFVPATVGEGGTHAVLDFGRLALAEGLAPGTAVTVGIRPEHIRIVPGGEGDFDIPVGSVESTGSATYVTSATQPELAIVENGRGLVRSGDVVGLAIDATQLHLFDSDGKRIEMVRGNVVPRPLQFAETARPQRIGV